MADGTILNPGSGGDTIDNEQVGGVKIPRGKIVLGARDVDGGDVSAANPLPVVSAASQPPTSFAALGAGSVVAEIDAGDAARVEGDEPRRVRGVAPDLQPQRWTRFGNHGPVRSDPKSRPGSTEIVGTDFFTDVGWTLSTAITLAMSSTPGLYTAEGTPVNFDISGTVL